GPPPSRHRRRQSERAVSDQSDVFRGSEEQTWRQGNGGADRDVVRRSEYRNTFHGITRKTRGRAVPRPVSEQKTYPSARSGVSTRSGDGRSTGRTNHHGASAGRAGGARLARIGLARLQRLDESIQWQSLHQRRPRSGQSLFPLPARMAGEGAEVQSGGVEDRLETVRPGCGRVRQPAGGLGFFGES